MRGIWIVLGVLCVGAVLGIRDFRRIKRHALRNAAGQCAACAAPLRVWFIRHIPYRYSKTGAPGKVEVCIPCYERYRWRRRLLWIGVAFSPVAMIVLMKVSGH